MAGFAVPAGSRSRTHRGRTFVSALGVEWREVGGLGRLATAGVVLSAAVVVVLGLWIEESVRHHLLEVRTELIQRIVNDLAVDGLLPLGHGEAVPEAVIDDAVEHRLIGGEVVAVAILDTTGDVVYGEPPGAGVPLSTASAPSPHVEQHADGLLHFVLPIEDAEGSRLGTFGVFQDAASFNEALARVGRNVWLAISAGLASLGVAMGAFTLAHARVLDRRRREALGLLRDLLRVEDEERRRIVGSLHDDVGQPLYRLLYGLEGCQARLTSDPEVTAELERLSDLVRDVDRTLRAELRHLHRSGLDALDLASGLEAVAQDCRDECDLGVEVTVDVGREPPSVARSVLLRAVQEALVNVRKHAVASNVHIQARGDERVVSVEVTDDGCGSTAPRGLGLTIVAERLDAIGGGLTVGRDPERGTVLRAWVPLDAVNVR